MTDIPNGVNKLMSIKQWLCIVILKAETKGFMFELDQSLFNRNYQLKRIKIDVELKCQMCDQCDETIDHLVSGCHVIRPTEYKTHMKKLVNTYSGRSANIAIHHMKKTGMNTNHNLFLKQIMSLSYGTLQYTLIEKFFYFFIYLFFT